MNNPANGLERKSPLTITDVRDNIEQKRREAQQEKERDSLFIAKSANEWMDIAKNQPMPNELFGPFWCEGELCILFGDTGSGKSLLSVQIADGITKGISTGNLSMAATPQKVLYFDLEQSPKQFEIRASQIMNNKCFNPYIFSDKLTRVEIQPGVTPDGEMSYQQFFDIEFGRIIDRINAKIIVVDNLTKIVGTDTDQSKTAKPLMDKLYNLKRSKGLSILAIEHTKKTDSSRRISFNDLQGSKMKANLCDSSFAIGKSTKASTTRYIKQMKYRNGDYDYTADNVIEYRINNASNFTQFEFVGYGHEDDHLRVITAEDRAARKQQAYDMHKAGKSNVEIAKEFGVTEGSIRKWLSSIQNNE